MSLPDFARRIAASRRGFPLGPIGRGAVSSMAIRVIALVLGFVQAVLAARLLGPAGYGVVAVAVSVAALVATVSRLGLEALAVREVPRLMVRSDWGALRGFLRFSAAAVAGVSVAAGAGVAAVALGTGLFDPAFRGAVAIGAALVPLAGLTGLLRGLNQGFGRVAAAQLPGEVLQPALMILALGLLLLSATPVAPRGFLTLGIGTAAIAVAVAAASLGRAVAGRVPATPPSLSPGAWGRAAAPFLGIAVLGMLGGELNTLMLGWLAGPAEAGLFQPVLHLSAVMVMGLHAVGMAYAPRVAELHERGEAATLRRITRLVTATTAAATALTCAAILLAAPWILAAFGPEFTGSTAAIRWLAAAQVFNTACGPVGMLLVMSRHPWRAFAGNLAGIGANVALGLWLIPGSGALGAAQAMAGGIVVWNVVMLISVRRHLGFDPSLMGLLRRSA